MRRGPGGRFVSRQAARTVEATTERYEYRRTLAGKMTEAVQVLTEKTVLKTTLRGVVERPGRDQGRLDVALYRTNVTTQLRGAKRIDITVKGKDGRDKAHRFKLSIRPDTDRNLSALMVARLIQTLRARGYRTQYRLEQVQWSKARSTRSRVRGLQVLHDVQVVVRVAK